MSGRNGQGPRGPREPDGSSQRADDGDEASGGHLATDPELEAALREAAAAIPDEAADERGAPVVEAELVADDPAEPARAGDAEPTADLARVQNQLSETHDRMLRLQADFENFRRRASREREEALHYGAQNLVKDLLSVVDNLERAIEHARQSSGGDLQGLLQGVELVQRELLGVLEKHHVVPVDAHGELFNPALHEAMAQAPDPTVAPNTVIDVLQKGYQLRDRLIRPARVVVARAPDESGGGGEGETSR